MIRDNTVVATPSSILSCLKHILLGALCAALLAACAGPMQQTDSSAEQRLSAAFNALSPGWNSMAPGGETLCSDGSEYRFFVKQGDPGKLLFYLEGGGACWSGMNCDPNLQPSYQINLAGTDPANAHGILAFEQQSNPLADYTVVYVPYCSGDVHLGNVEQDYRTMAADERPAGTVHIHHRGWVNAASALDWVEENGLSPEQIFVTGSSAGSIPSPFYAVKLAQEYPDARVVQLGDGSGGYRDFVTFSPYEVWGLDDVVGELPNIPNIPADDFKFLQLYQGAAQLDLGIRFASYDTAEDEVQKQFLALAGTPVDSLKPQLETNLADISRAIPDFRYYVAGGDVHTILLRPEVYSYEVAGVRFVDWLAALVRGDAVDNVMCTDCSVAPDQ